MKAKLVRAIMFGPVLTALVVLSVVLSACANPPDRGVAAEVKDFNLVAYQGEALLGGRESTFARIFEQGKPVVLNFWAGQCPPCRAEMPGFQQAAEAYQDRVIFVGVDVGAFTGLGTHEDARRLLAELGIRYPAAYALDATPLRLYNVRGMPTTVFLTPKGRIVESVGGFVFGAQLSRSIEKLLAASS